MTDPAAPSSVKQRKRKPGASTQRFLPIAEIRGDTVALKNGGLRAIIAIEALNFNLKSEVEQQAIIAGYGAFVNTLTFPLQIVMRSTKTNVDEYLNTLSALGAQQKNERLAEQTDAYVRFIQRMLDVADIMQKRFYVVVPLDRAVRHKTLLEQFFEWLSPDDTAAKAAQRAREFQTYSKQLTERVDLVSAGLNSIGLHTRRLNTRDLLELFYQIYNPKTSQEQKIPQDLNPLREDVTKL